MSKELVIKKFAPQRYVDNHGVRGKFFVVKGGGFNALYLHRDGATLHKNCGKDNFYITEEEAQECIDLYKSLHNNNDDNDFHITEEEMSV